MLVCLADIPNAWAHFNENFIFWPCFLKFFKFLFYKITVVPKAAIATDEMCSSVAFEGPNQMSIQISICK